MTIFLCFPLTVTWYNMSNKIFTWSPFIFKKWSNSVFWSFEHGLWSETSKFKVTQGVRLLEKTPCLLVTLHKKWSFPLRIFSVNVTKSAGNYGYGHIYWSNSWRKTSFFVQCSLLPCLPEYGTMKPRFYCFFCCFISFNSELVTLFGEHSWLIIVFITFTGKLFISINTFIKWLCSSCNNVDEDDTV